MTLRRVFFRHPHLLRSFLNAMLPLPAGTFVESLEYLPADMVPEELLSSAGIREAIENLQVSAFSKNELASYDKYWDSVRTENLQHKFSMPPVFFCVPFENRHVYLQTISKRQRTFHIFPEHEQASEEENSPLLQETAGAVC